MKPGNYAPALDPNADGMTLRNPIDSTGGTLSESSSVVNLGEAIGGRLGTTKGHNLQVGDMAQQAGEVVSQFKSLTGSNGYGPVDRTVQAAGNAGRQFLQGLSTAIGRLKVG